MFIGGFGFLLDSLTNYYLFSVLTTVFALAGTYFVCFHHKQFESKNLTTDIPPNESTTISQATVYKEDVSKKCEVFHNAESGISQNSEVPSNETSEISDKTIMQDLETGAEIKKPAKVAEMVIKAGMSDEQMKQEKQAQKEQLAEIFKLMQKQADKFGSVTLDDVEEQMKLYR